MQHYHHVLLWACRVIERPHAVRCITCSSTAHSSAHKSSYHRSSVVYHRRTYSRVIRLKREVGTELAATPSNMEPGAQSLPAAAAASQSGHQQPRRKKQKNSHDPHWQAITSAMKCKNAEAAWRSYSEGEGRVTFQPGLLKAMATLFLGMEDWVRHVLQLPGDASVHHEPPLQVHVQWAQHVLEIAQKSTKSSDDQLLALKARLFALNLEPEAALQCAEEGVATGTVRLRLYTPALAAFAAIGDAAGAMRTFERVCSHGADINDLTELEYHHLVHVICSKGTYDDLCKVLEHMGSRLGALSPAVLETLRAGFRKGMQASDGTILNWDLLPVRVDPKGDGFVEEVQDSLLELTLQPEEWAQFAVSVQELAQSRERKVGSFEKFVAMMQQQDHSVFLDAANIAYFNTMKFITENKKDCDERFQWPQVIKIYDLVRKTFPQSRVMVVAHNYRCRDKFVRSSDTRAFIAKLKRQGDLWVTPNGSNDDWYWLYGVISKGSRGMLISNDDMRDHIFELLRPRYFVKWREHHRCTYSVSTEDDGVDATLELPQKFSTCIQLLPHSGCWMFPGREGTWLCARPQSEAT
eukprot:jgi/Ulvmu1/5144/UM021_0161.1